MKIRRAQSIPLERTRFQRDNRQRGKQQATPDPRIWNACFGQVAVARKTRVSMVWLWREGQPSGADADCADSSPGWVMEASTADQTHHAGTRGVAHRVMARSPGCGPSLFQAWPGTFSKTAMGCRSPSRNAGRSHPQDHTAEDDNLRFHDPQTLDSLHTAVCLDKCFCVKGMRPRITRTRLQGRECYLVDERYRKFWWSLRGSGNQLVSCGVSRTIINLAVEGKLVLDAEFLQEYPLMSG